MCGIFGIINSEKKPFDYQTFCTLGICNDERGGDSCGVFIDGKYEYGVNDKKYFSEFYMKSDIIQNTERARIALGHCRKASVGAVNEKTAQPVVIENKGKIEFVVIHNGTIYNYEDLAKKYIPDVDITGMTDSQIMARIFYYCGYDVLKEYNGGSAFVICDYRKEKPDVFIFKGASLNTVISSAPVEERPLFLTFSRGTVIFSSIGRYLRTKRRNKELYTCTPNILYRINQNSELEKVEEYDRSDQYQFRHDVYSKYDALLYGQDGYGYYGYGKKYNYSDNKNNDKKEDKSLSKYLLGYHKKEESNRFILSNDDGTYSVENVLAQGFFFINRKGKIVSAKDKDEENVHVFFFWQGVMLYNKECYKFLKKVCKAYNITEGQLIEDYPLLVHSLSPDPFRDEQSFGDNNTYIAVSDAEFEIAKNEQWQYFMSKNCYYFDSEGTVAGSWESDNQRIEATFDDYVRMGNTTYIDFANLIDTYKVY